LNSQIIFKTKETVLTFALLFIGVGHDEEPDIEKVPDAVPRGVFKPVTLQTGHDPTLVMFDLETTDLSKNYNN
jgi:hypothetical protein